MRIIVVDDEPSVLRVVKQCLELDHHIVEAVTDPAQALAKIRASGFDLALVDLSLPGITGDELIREMNRSKPGLPIVLMTGLAPDKPLPGTALALYKPFSAAMLRETIAIFQPAPADKNGDHGVPP
jgi:CheY-like chemotaxis protein